MRRRAPDRTTPAIRLLIDTLGAPTTSGGMRLHATELLRAWSERYPEDDVVVVGGSWTTGLSLAPGFRLVRWPNDNPIVRAIGQQLFVPLVYRLTRRSRLLATNSVLSPMVPANRSTVVAHDWRHLRRPQEFSRFQRVYRRNWLSSARRAAHVVAVSAKTAGETRRLVGPEKVVVVENGRDHAARWPASSLVQPAVVPAGPFVLTYGQHTNKRPELVVQALAAGALPPTVVVVVLGAGAETAARLRSEAAELAVPDRVVPLSYVDEGEYRWLVTHAAAVALVSSDEGFGLPLAEAASLGVPAVVASDSGIADLFAGTAVVAQPEGASVAAALVTAISAGNSANRATTRTWDVVAQEVRQTLEVPGRR